MWKNSLKNAESDKNKILYENLLDFFTAKRNYFLNKPRTTTTTTTTTITTTTSLHANLTA